MGDLDPGPPVVDMFNITAAESLVVLRIPGRSFDVIFG